MYDLLIELYSLTDIELKTLQKRFSDESLLKARKYFLIGSTSRPVNILHLFYYVDQFGDFINRGKKLHYRIARAIFNSLSNSEKLQILEYIDGSQNKNDTRH